jgi:hypothetical protein
MPSGDQVEVKMLDTSPVPPGPNGNGTLFGLVVAPGASGVYFVDELERPQRPSLTHLLVPTGEHDRRRT